MRLSYLKIQKLIGFDTNTQKGIYKDENKVNVYRSVKTQNIAINELAEKGENVHLAKVEDFYIDKEFATAIAMEIADYFIEKLPKEQREQVKNIVLDAFKNACIIER